MKANCPIPRRLAYSITVTAAAVFNLHVVLRRTRTERVPLLVRVLNLWRGWGLRVPLP